MAFEFTPHSMVRRIFWETSKKCKGIINQGSKGSRLSYEEIKTVLLECEPILNNRLLTYIYPTDLTSYLTPNHLFYGRVIQSSSTQSSPLTHEPSELTAYSNQVTTVINRSGDKWRFEYLVNLLETHKYYCPNKNQPFIQLSDVVSAHSDKTPRYMLRMGVVTGLIDGKMDNNIRGALVRTITHCWSAQSTYFVRLRLSDNSLLKRPVNIFFPFEYVRSNRQEPADTENLRRSRRKSAEIGQLRWRFVEWTMIEILVPNIWCGVWELLYENRCTTSLIFFIF